MAKYGLVAGETARDVMTRMVENFDGMDVAYAPAMMEDVIEDLTVTGGIQLRELKALLVLDYAFNFGSMGDLDKVAEEFVAVQDLMQSNQLGVTLYLITRNTDLYDKLQGSVSGVPGIYYDHVQVLLTKDDYRAALIRSVLLGERDNMGLYNKNVRTKKTRKELIEEEQRAELERRRNLKEELIKFDSVDPLNDITEMDYIDSTQRKVHEEEKRKQEELELRRKKREERRRKEPEPEEEKDVEVNIYTGTKREVREYDEGEYDGRERIEKRSQVNEKEEDEDVRLHEIFKGIRGVGELAEGKIETDKGVISVVGDYASGASGVVANMAEMYTMAGRNVLVVDLDIQNRMQTIYFKQYDTVVKNNRGTSDSLIEVIQGYRIADNAVPITKRLHVLSVSRNDEVSLDWVTAVAGNIETLLIEARRMYDVIILDIPFRLFRDYIRVFKYVDVNIFVVENKFYKVENFLENVLHPLLLDMTVEMETLITKSNVIINKFKRGLRDEEGREVNRRYIRRALDGIGYPYDNMGVAGEIPYYDQWENQFLTGVRYVWQDNVALGVFRRVIGKVVV